MTESMLETSSQPGLILKTAREELAMTIEQVAQELHLRPTVVKALEEEKYCEFSSDVFLKGYFRTYCRLVKLHEERMIELLENQLNSIKKESDKSQEQLVKAKQSRKRRKQFVTLIIFLVCASLVYLAYLVSTGSTTLFSNNSPVEPVQTEDTPPVSKMVESEVEESSDTLEKSMDQEDHFPESIDQAELKSSKTVQELFNENDGTEITSTETSTELTASNQSVNTEETITADVIQDQGVSVENDEDADPGLATLQVSFTGDCWFKLTDGLGKTAIADLKRENEQVNYQGVAPFHIVIGDASKASLIFDGEVIDLAAYSTRNGRAELNLKRKDTQIRAE